MRTTSIFLLLLAAPSAAFSPWPLPKAHDGRRFTGLAMFNDYLSTLEPTAPPPAFETDETNDNAAAPASDASVDWSSFSPGVVAPPAPPAPAEPAYAEPAYAEPAFVEPAYVEPAFVEPAYAEPATPPAATTAPPPPNNQHKSTPSHNIGNLLLQRTIQTQLYYLADLRDEPTYAWLRSFLDQNHLDDRGRFNELDGIHYSWHDYLHQLQNAPPFTITVQLAPPRLSAQQKRNPYLAQQVSGKSYEETINPAQIYQTIKAVARSLEKEWADDLASLAASDRERVRLYFDREVPRLQTQEYREREYYLKMQVVAGGEGDDQGTPLYKLNARLVARFATRVALHSLVDELQENIAAAAQSSDGGGSSVDEETRQKAAQWLLHFSNEWLPRLRKGADDAKRRGMGTPPPGQWQRLCDGADAEDVTEALWQELPQLFAEVNDETKTLYAPEALSARLRGARADVCDMLAEELRVLMANEFS
uniref:Uncharacterized protein n=2 Tax=Ditylum brightwellii TaxID=49249 RepID=A0A7S1ZW69_9STRA|mmetsp:Transcript_39785/g.59767  ORF Transcript_39785/g.59767 Transcript_39785/m.59767 type:complete len:477 (+) Transcript_39785:274-1704(+)